MLGCNVKYEKNDKLVFEPYKIINIKGVKVGLIGLVNPDISETVLKKNLDGLKIDSSLDSMNFWISEIIDDVDIIILLTSSGVPWDRDKIYDDFVSNYKKTGTFNKNLNSIELGYFSDEVDLIVSGGISKGYNTPSVSYTHLTLPTKRIV